jgi:hypothetical protein
MMMVPVPGRVRVRVASENWCLVCAYRIISSYCGSMQEHRNTAPLNLRVLCLGGDLNLRVLCPGGGDKRAKRSTSAAGGLSTEWTWKCNPKHAKRGECKEHRAAESARLVPWGRGQTREAQHKRRQRAQHQMDLEVHHKTRKTWRMQGARGS